MTICDCEPFQTCKKCDMKMSEMDFNKMMKNSHAKIRDNVRPSLANLERNSGHATKKPYEDEAFNKRVVVTVHSFRYRLADPDGLCAKYHIDSIVDSGLLADDTPKEIKEVRFKQTKIKKPETEKTVVTLQEIED